MPSQVLDTEGREVQVFDAFAFNGNFEVKATGYKGMAAKATMDGETLVPTVTNIDFAVGAEDRYMNGLRLLLKNHAFDDTLGLQVVDKDNVLGYGAGLVLKTFGTNWNVNSGSEDQGQNTFNYVAKIPAGIYIRIVYVSTGLTDVVVKLNALFHRKTS